VRRSAFGTWALAARVNLWTVRPTTNFADARFPRPAHHGRVVRAGEAYTTGPLVRPTTTFDIRALPLPVQRDAAITACERFRNFRFR